MQTMDQCSCPPRYVRSGLLAGLRIHSPRLDNKLPVEAEIDALPYVDRCEPVARAAMEGMGASEPVIQSILAMLPAIIGYGVIQVPWPNVRYIPSAVRRRVLAVGLCAYCSSTKELVVDHVFPFAFGGSNAEYNLQCLCAPCNGRKGKRLPEA